MEDTINIRRLMSFKLDFLVSDSKAYFVKMLSSPFLLNLFFLTVHEELIM